MDQVTQHERRISVLYRYVAGRMSEAEWSEHVARDPLLSDMLRQRDERAPSEDFQNLMVISAALVLLGVIASALALP